MELLVLTVPPQTLVWILDESHIRGEEFTMGGRPVRLEPVPPKSPPPADVPEPSDKGKVIPLTRKP